MLDGIQVLRAVAAVAVVIHHSLTNLARSAGVASPLNSLGSFEDLGAAGVDLFFVISGFIMFYVSHRSFGKRDIVASFLYRRAIRIYPLYWLYTLAIIGLSCTPWFYRNLQIDLPYAVQSLLLVPAQRPGSDDTIHPILDQGWTLSYELGFYLLFAICLRFGSARSTLLVLPTTFLVLTTIGASLGAQSALGQFLSLPLTFEFAFGVAIAYLLLNHPQIARGHRFAALAGVVLFGASAALHVASEWRPVVWGVPSALLVYAATGWHISDSRFNRLAVALGNASYSIYLTHAFVIMAAVRLLKGHLVTDLEGVLLQAATAAVSVAFGYVAYITVERPMMARLAKTNSGTP